MKKIYFIFCLFIFLGLIGINFLSINNSNGKTTLNINKLNTAVADPGEVKLGMWAFKYDFNTVETSVYKKTDQFGNTSSCSSVIQKQGIGCDGPGTLDCEPSCNANGTINCFTIYGLETQLINGPC